MPMGVADECAMSRCVPTVLRPSSRYGATLSFAVFSMSVTMAGVAKTSRSPLPKEEAVFSLVTVTDDLPLIPMLSMPRAMTVRLIRQTAPASARARGRRPRARRGAALWLLRAHIYLQPPHTLPAWGWKMSSTGNSMS